MRYGHVLSTKFIFSHFLCFYRSQYVVLYVVLCMLMYVVVCCCVCVGGGCPCGVMNDNNNLRHRPSRRRVLTAPVDRDNVTVSVNGRFI